ncbi:hypothetical protein [Xanthomonas hortorum]|uniref:hypothetical protein n=1 Tax=Xanthomonas hortorum TaxID=56454 RepID=UPI0005C60D08|nr:hypothetical protein [Xanthomonas hortorum]
MSMTDGIKVWVDGALDTMDETARKLIDGGVEPNEALKAAKIMTKQSVADCLERNLGDLSASEFTHGLRTQPSRPLPN